MRKQRYRARLFNLTHSLKPLARSVVRRNRIAIARQAMKDARIRKKIVQLMGKVVSKELTRLSSRNVNSSLRHSSVECIEELDWNALVQELEAEAPVMLSLLRECVQVKLRAYQPKGRGGRSARHLPSQDAAIGMCFAMLLRARCQQMNCVQRMISMLIYGSHAPKQVCRCTEGLTSYCCACHTRALSHLLTR